MKLRIVVWSLLSFATLFAACGGGSERVVEQRIPAPGTFVYTQGVDLWIQDEDGARLLIAAGQDQQLLHPAISPDGARVAYIVFQVTQAEGSTIGTDLAIADLSKSEQQPEQQIVVEHTKQAEFIWNPRWSPDGGSLIFTHEPGKLLIRVARLDLQRGVVEILREDARDADISADGSRLVFVSAPYSGDPHLVVRDLADGSELVLDPEREWQPRPYRIPRFVPDANAVVFSAGQFLPQVSLNALGLNGPEDLWLVDLETRELLQIAAIGEDQPDFAISDDGGHVLVMGAFGMYLVTTDATDPPYAIAPGEFHGGIDWVGVVDDEEWAAIRESVFQIQDSPQ